MKSSTIISLEKDLSGKSLLSSVTGEKLGEVIDLIVHPVQGTVLGIAVQTTTGNRQMLAARDVLIGDDAVMAGENYRFEDSFDGFLADGVFALKELAGIPVMTEDGRAVGRISDIYLSRLRPKVFYRVTTSTLQRFIGGGFFITGDTIKAFPSDGKRIIVPADVADHFAYDSLQELANIEESDSRDRGRGV